MGRLRGKRNRDQDRYWTEQRRAEQSGMVGASDAAPCSKCGGLSVAAEMHKGWCLSCVGEWVQSADPWLIYQAKSQLPLAALPTVRLSNIERLEAMILEHTPDADFLPLTQFMGHRGIGHMRSMWNFLLALFAFELETTAQAAKLGVVAPNTVHLCGRHAPVPRTGIIGFLSRINSAGGDFKLFRRDPYFVDYIRGFASDNRLTIFTYQKTSVDVYDRAATERMVAKYGKPHFDKYCPVHWPFEPERDSRKREYDEMEPLPDIVMQIGDLVPKYMPSTLREDLCQDLVVAVLSGEATIDNLRGSIKYYIQQAFKHHPLKYGRYTLEVQEGYSTGRWDHNDGRAYRPPITDEDSMFPGAINRAGWPVDPDPDMHGWHQGKDRPIGMATVGDQLRQKHGGYAIEGGVALAEPEDIDQEIADVFYADSHPQWRHKLSD